MYQRQSLERWSEQVLGACGVDSADAAIAAQTLIRANLRGIDTHGISRLPAYVAMLRSSEMNARPSIQVEDRAGTFVMEADRALGQLAGMRAMAIAIEAAKTRAIVSMSIRKTGHLGALGVLAVQAAEHGMISVLMQNGPPIMGLPGSTAPAIGNNPLAFAMPTTEGPPLVFDMAASETAFGRIIDAARNGAAIPAGWAIDEYGAETTDPTAAMRGMLLPTGAFKGVGIAMLVECLAGSLSGVYLEKMEPGRTLPPMFGGFLMVINPSLLIGEDAFAVHRDKWLNRFKSSREDMRYPGERAARVEAERSQNGIPLPATVVQQLSQLGESVGAPWMFGVT